MCAAEHQSGCISIAASVVHATSTAATVRAATAPASVAIAVTNATTAPPASVTITAAGVSRQCGGGGVSSCLLLSPTTSWTLYSLPFRAVSPFYEPFFIFFRYNIWMSLQCWGAHNGCTSLALCNWHMRYMGEISRFLDTKQWLRNPTCHSWNHQTGKYGNKIKYCSNAVCVPRVSKYRSMSSPSKTVGGKPEEGGVLYKLHYGDEVADCRGRTWLRDTSEESDDVASMLGDNDVFGVEQEAHYKLLTAREVELARGEAACMGTPLDVIAVSDVKSAERRSKLRKAVMAATELFDRRPVVSKTQVMCWRVCVGVCVTLYPPEMYPLLAGCRT